MPLLALVPLKYANKKRPRSAFGRLVPESCTSPLGPSPMLAMGVRMEADCPSK